MASGKRQGQVGRVGKMRIGGWGQESGIRGQGETEVRVHGAVWPGKQGPG